MHMFLALTRSLSATALTASVSKWPLIFTNCAHAWPWLHLRYISCFQMGTPENVRLIGSGLSLEFVFHTWTMRQEILCSDVFTITQIYIVLRGGVAQQAPAGHEVNKCCGDCICLKLSWHLHLCLLDVLHGILVQKYLCTLSFFMCVCHVSQTSLKHSACSWILGCIRSFRLGHLHSRIRPLCKMSGDYPELRACLNVAGRCIVIGRVCLTQW